MSTQASGLEGSLDEVGFADVLRLIRGSQQSGTLRIHSDPEQIVVVARNTVNLASSGEAGLRDALLGGGLIDAATWTEVIAAHGEDPHPGAALGWLAHAGVDPERLRSRIYEHTISTLFELLLPSSARFAFQADTSHPFAVEPGFPFDDVLADVEHRVNEWRTIAEAIPSTSVVLQQAARLPATASSITLTPEEFELLGLLDGNRDVAQLVAHLGMSAFSVMTALHRLMQRGAVEEREALP